MFSLRVLSYYHVVVDRSLVYVSCCSKYSEVFWIFFTFYYGTLFPGYVIISYSFPLISSFVFAAQITEYLYPFLKTTSNARSFEYLRLTTLGVFGALVKVIYT